MEAEPSAAVLHKELPLLKTEYVCLISYQSVLKPKSFQDLAHFLAFLVDRPIILNDMLFLFF